MAGIETMGIQEHLPRDNARWDLTMPNERLTVCNEMNFMAMAS
jgi:hypothetical protein